MPRPPKPAPPSPVVDVDGDACFPDGFELSADDVTSVGCEHGQWDLQDDGSVGYRGIDGGELEPAEPAEPAAPVEPPADPTPDPAPAPPVE